MKGSRFERFESGFGEESADWGPYLFRALSIGFYLLAALVAISDLVVGISYLRLSAGEAGAPSLLGLFWHLSGLLALPAGLACLGRCAWERRNLNLVHVAATSAFLFPLALPVVRYALGKPSSPLRFVMSGLSSDEDQMWLLGTLWILAILIFLTGLFLAGLSLFAFRRPDGKVPFQ